MYIYIYIYMNMIPFNPLKSPFTTNKKTLELPMVIQMACTASAKCSKPSALAKSASKGSGITCTVTPGGRLGDGTMTRESVYREYM